MVSGHRSLLNIWCTLIGIGFAGCLSDGAGVPDDGTPGLATRVEELSQPPQAGNSAPVKANAVKPPIPVKPPVPPGVTTDGTLPAKPAASAAADAAAVAAVQPWTINLVASAPSLWLGGYTTLTATTNMDVGPTTNYIRIWDDLGGNYIATCGGGTTCTISVNQTTPHTATFKAVVGPAGGAPLASAYASVYWHAAGIRMTESESTVSAGSSVVLTTFTDYDVQTSSYWVQIYDDTARTIVGSCGFGSMCSVTVSQATPTTHRYRACFSTFTATYPPPSVLECTPQKFVSWTANPALRVFLQPSSTNTVTATSSINVTGTQNYIQIFKANGARIAVCNTGTICSASNVGCEDHMIAFVGPLSATIQDIERRAPAISHLFPTLHWTHWAQWTSVLQGNVAGPCPSPPPK